MIMAATTVFSLGIQGWVLRYLPIVDCLPYKVGHNILEKRKIPAGAIPDSTVINFVYLRNGKEIEFDADHFPVDFSDTGYTFVRRYDKLIRKGNAEPPIKDFVLINEQNTDSTEALLSRPGAMMILFVKHWDASWKDEVATLKAVAEEKNIPFLIASSTADQVRADVSVPVMKSDLVAIKTAARVDPTLYLLRDGTITGKWAIANLDKAVSFIRKP
jgi:hypothetical protein